MVVDWGYLFGVVFVQQVVFLVDYEVFLVVIRGGVYCIGIVFIGDVVVVEYQDFVVWVEWVCQQLVFQCCVGGFIVQYYVFDVIVLQCVFCQCGGQYQLMVFVVVGWVFGQYVVDFCIQ